MLKKTFVLFFLLSLIAGEGFSQDQKITTFILIRHGEKLSEDGMSKDVDLSEQGIERANKLVSILKNTEVNAIYSTNYKRTKNTVASVAKEKGVEIQLYDLANPQEVDKMIAANTGKTILVCGHSNTIPKIANWLTGTEDYKDFPSSEYGNILVISVIEKGKSAKVVWMNY